MNNKIYGCFLFIFGLILAFVLAHSASADEHCYSAGSRAFSAGDDLKAAELMIRAAREDEKCRAVFEDPLLQSLPPACPEKSAGVSISDPAPLVLFQLGRLRWRDETEKLEARGILRKNQHSRVLFEELTKQYPSSPYSDDAALMLLEDRVCYSNEGYPDCGMFEIREYEGFLTRYPLSDKAPEVLVRIAGLYLELARIYAPSESGGEAYAKPWENKSRAELFLGQAEKICKKAIENYSGSPESRKARRFLHEIELSPLTPASVGSVRGY